MSGALRPNTDPGSKPETQTSSEATLNPFLTIPSSHSQDRKLDISEEDEEDRVERERLLTTLKLMGVENGVIDNGLISPSVTEGSPLKPAETAGRPSPSTTFSRFSAFFGRPASPNNMASPVALSESSRADDEVEPARSREESIRKRSSVMIGSLSNPVLDTTHYMNLGQPASDTTREPERMTLSAAEASEVFSNANPMHTSHHRTKGGETSLSTLWSLGSEGRDM